MRQSTRYDTGNAFSDCQVEINVLPRVRVIALEAVNLSTASPFEYLAWRFYYVSIGTWLMQSILNMTVRPVDGIMVNHVSYRGS